MSKTSQLSNTDTGNWNNCESSTVYMLKENLMDQNIREHLMKDKYY